ncbi:Quinolinate synthase [Psidium guajava]|nr:Quinolinate synthase [Psidium guajava]
MTLTSGEPTPLGSLEATGPRSSSTEHVEEEIDLRRALSTKFFGGDSSCVSCDGTGARKRGGGVGIACAWAAEASFWNLGPPGFEDVGEPLVDGFSGRGRLRGRVGRSIEGLRPVTALPDGFGENFAAEAVNGSVPARRGERGLV